MSPRRAYAVVRRVVPSLWLIGLCGAAPTVGSPGVVADELDVGQLREQVTQLRSHVASLVQPDDLLDSLHFAWFDRPYARATLAILVKTTSMLERESRLRARGNGAIPDGRVRNMLSWAQRATNRIVTARPDPDFRPHRLRATAGKLTDGSVETSLFGVVDGATSTCHHRLFGDLDLIAAAGFRVYGRVDRGSLPPHAGPTWHERANSLGMATVRVLATGGPAAGGPIIARGCDLTIDPVKITRLLRQSSILSLGESATALAVLDNASGEPLASTLARRALVRGVAQRNHFVVDGWTPPTVGRRASEHPRSVTAAMWVDAVEGQSLALIHGWRDLRDGSATTYRSVLTEPARMEAAAWTALDLIRLGRYIAALRSTPILAVAVDPTAISADDDNAWADWIEPVWKGLLQRQIRYDVVPLAADLAELHRRYRVVFPIRSADVADETSLFLRLERMLAAQPEHVERLTLLDQDGRIARDVYARGAVAANGAPRVVVVNLGEAPRQVRLHNGPKLPRMRDHLSGEVVEDPRQPIALDAWQIRLLLSEH